MLALNGITFGVHAQESCQDCPVAPGFDLVSCKGVQVVQPCCVQLVTNVCSAATSASAELSVPRLRCGARMRAIVEIAIQIL